MSSQTLATSRETWQIDPAHTLVEFSVKHLMIATVKGRFGGVTGTVVTGAEAPDQAEIEASIDAATIDTGVGQRDDHLRSPDFLDVQSHPTITYDARYVERTGPDTLRVYGDLTIRGVRRPVVLTVEDLGRVTDTYGAERAAYSAQARINRKDFGLTWNVGLETGGVLVGDEVKISIEVQLVRA